MLLNININLELEKDLVISIMIIILDLGPIEYLAVLLMLVLIQEIKEILMKNINLFNIFH